MGPLGVMANFIGYLVMAIVVLLAAYLLARATLQ